jgi:hypothetical protein
MGSINDKNKVAFLERSVGKRTRMIAIALVPILIFLAFYGYQWWVMSARCIDNICY